MLFNTELYELFIPPFLLIGISVLLSFLITFLVIPGIVSIAREKGLMAHPNGRTSHLHPTPNLGGIAIFAGVIISSVLFTGITTAHELKYIIAGMLVLFFVGLYDDLMALPPWKKLLGQAFAVVFILVPGSLYLNSLHGLFGIHEISYAGSLILTIFLCLAFINSFNLIDGIDGLASGIGILASIFFGIVFLQNGPLAYAIMSFILASSLLAFNYFNVFSKRNKIFLGDTGSMLVGLLLSIFSIRFLNMENGQFFSYQLNTGPAVLLCVFIVPIYDTARVMVLRILKGKSPFEADRNHIHHHMLGLQGTHLKASLSIITINILFVAMPFLFSDVVGEELILTTFALSTLSFHVPMYLNARRKKPVYESKLPRQEYQRQGKRAS